MLKIQGLFPVAFPSEAELCSTKDVQHGEELSLYFVWDHYE